jgi:hypothetical protein
MKSKRNISIYFLSASLIFVGISNAQNSQGATSSTNQIASLQKQVKTLSDKVDALTAISNRQASKFSGLHDCLFSAVPIGGSPSSTPIYDCLWRFSVN